MHGTCPLCRLDAELVDSHMIPAAAYRLLRGDGPGDPNPVISVGDASFTSSEQVSQPLLCRFCEDRLNKNGERYVLSQCLRGSEGFPLRELLSQHKPLADLGPQNRVYDLGALIGADVTKYIYFAISVIWRAGVVSWRIANRRIDRLALGPYKETLRRFLLGAEALPDSCYVQMLVMEPERDGFPMFLPYSIRVDGTRRHAFAIPGLVFYLFVGKKIAPQARAASLTAPEPHLVYYGGLGETELARGMVKSIRQARPRGKLAKRAKVRG